MVLVSRAIVAQGIPEVSTEREGGGEFILCADGEVDVRELIGGGKSK